MTLTRENCTEENGFSCSKIGWVQKLAAQTLHRKIAVITVTASGLATIPLQKSQGFSLRRPKIIALGVSLKIAAHSDHVRKSPQPRDLRSGRDTDKEGREKHPENTPKTPEMYMGLEGSFPCCFVFLLLFFAFSFCCAFLRLSSLIFRFPSLSSLILLGQEQTTVIFRENGELHSEPVCTDPVQNFPITILT